LVVVLVYLMKMNKLFISLSIICLGLSVICMSDQKVSAIITGKMNDDGEYINIRGINFIAMANGIWRDEVHHAVKDHAPVLGQYINPLPGSSYHMTVHPLFTEHSLPEFFMKRYASDWDSMWIHIMNLVTPHIHSLIKDLPSRLHAEYLRPVIGNGVTVLALRLPRDEATSMAKFRARIRDTVGVEMLHLLQNSAKSLEERNSAQEWYDQVFVEPSQPSAAMSYRYHLTLGYSRKLAELLTTEQLNALNEESDMIDAVVKNLVCPDYEKPGDKCVITLERPTFDWFHSMTAFDEIEVVPAKTPKLSMFFKVFPVNDDPYVSHALQYVICICSILVVIVLFLIVKKRGFSLLKIFNSKRPILPLTTSKASQHEA